MTKPKLALFDLDHTLLPLDSDDAWGRFIADLGWVEAEPHRRRLAEFYAQYKAQTLDMTEYVRFATSAFVARGEQAARTAHARFMREVISPVILPKTRRLLDGHREEGARIVIITATNEFVTTPIAEELGADALLAVDLERDPATGWFDGRIRGTPSFREGKVTRVAQWLAAEGLDWSGVETTFYSDSINDLPLLEKVDRPVAANPDAPLRALAQARGWRILEHFSEDELIGIV